MAKQTRQSAGKSDLCVFPEIPQWMHFRGKPQPRHFRVHAPFHLPGDDTGWPQELIEFTELWQELRRRTQDVRAWVATRDMDRLKRQVKAFRIVAEAIAKGDDEIKAAAKKIDRLGFTMEERKRLADEMKEALNGKTELIKAAQRPKTSREEIAREERRIKESGQAIELNSKINDLCFELRALAENGNEVAIECIAEIGSFGAITLQSLAHTHPKSVSKSAREATYWPVIASTAPDWDLRAKDLLRRIELGTGSYLAELNPSVAHDSAPIRQWARQAYETLWLNRQRAPVFDHIKKQTKLLMREYDFTFTELPSWAVKTAALPPFAKSTTKAWADVAKQMIRSECPDFHERDEWKNFRQHHSNLNRDGLPSKGRLQNDILEKIGAAMKALARNAVPDSGNLKPVS